MEWLENRGRRQEADIYRPQALAQMSRSQSTHHALIEGASFGYDALRDERVVTKVTVREVKTRVLGVKIASRTERPLERYMDGRFRL